MMQIRAAQRIAYIDGMKGIACQIMVFAHAITMNFGVLSVPEKAFFTFIIYPAGLFFLASGINVVLFVEHAEGKKDFASGKFFLASAAALFVLSLPYSINRNNLYVLQIFQGIAVTTAATYLLLRARLSNAALVLFAYASYGVWFAYWYQLMPDLAILRVLDSRVLSGETLAWLHTLGPVKRFFFANFSVIPWVSYMLIGAAWYRSRRDHPEHALRWVALFLVSIAIGVGSVFIDAFDQPLLLDNLADMLFRNAPVHFFTWMGLNGLTAMACARWYQGAASLKTERRRKVMAFVEFTGKESLMFFVWHWVMLFGASVALAILGRASYLGRPPWKTHLTWIIALYGVAWTLPKVVEFGARWRKRRNFVYESMALWIVGSIFSLGIIRGRSDIPPLAFVISLVASISFAIYYPLARSLLRKKFTAKPARMPK
jgi:surface polysaccharide O-acyltransferase-like enzyme